MKNLLVSIVVFCVFILSIHFAEAISLKEAYKSKKSDIQVQGSGTVIRILKDDNQGSRHQKFILKLSSG